MRKLSTLVLAATAATSILGSVASAAQPAPLCGTYKRNVSSGQCTYFPESKTGSLSISGTGHADVVCAGGGYAQLTSTGGSKRTTFQRAVFSSLVPCVLTWAGVDPFSASAS